jgi:hypothetical protein
LPTLASANIDVRHHHTHLKYEIMQIILAGWFVRVYGIGWAGDYDSLKFSRAAFIEESRGGIFFRQVVVGLVSIIHSLADIQYYGSCLVLLAEATRYES